MITTIGKQVGKKAFKVEAPRLLPINSGPTRVPDTSQWGKSGTVWKPERDSIKDKEE